MTLTTEAPLAVYAPVRLAFVYVSDDCPLRCDYCFVSKEPRRMSVETARKTVDFLYQRTVSGAETVLHINFFGGEPFLEPEVMAELIRYAREKAPNHSKKPVFCATTSGVIATPAVESIIRDSGMQLLISVDGDVNATSHRPFLSGRSSYDVVARNLPKLVNWASVAIARTTFHPDALDLVGNVRHVLSLGAPAVALCPVVEAHWNGHEDALETAYEALADWFIEEARQGPPPPLTVTMTLLRMFDQAQRGAKRPARPCGMGHSLISIDTEGTVLPCHRMLYRKREKLGDVDMPQFDARRNPYLTIASRDILGCDGCVAEPVCGGGCRVVAMSAGYDLHTGAHPSHCLLTRAHARVVRRIYETLTSESNPWFLSTLRSRSSVSPAVAEALNR